MVDTYLETNFQARQGFFIMSQQKFLLKSTVNVISKISGRGREKLDYNTISSLLSLHSLVYLVKIC